MNWQYGLSTSESRKCTLKCAVTCFNQHKMEPPLKTWTSPLMQFILLFPTFSFLYDPFPHKEQDSFSCSSPLIFITCDRKNGWIRTGNEEAAGDGQNNIFYCNGDVSLSRLQHLLLPGSFSR